ncbi:MAG: sugar transporter substrate-binding protein, partial [Eubacterium sp.]|nr:sugar transporter substrate-binding protein [Eubacterium sp.]
MKKHLNFKRVVSLIAAVAMSVTMLAGCGNNTEPAAQSTQSQATGSTAAESSTTQAGGTLKGEITQWVWGDYEKKGAVDFNKSFPDIKVNYVMVPQNDYFKKLQTTAASNGEMPDVANLEMTA